MHGNNYGHPQHGGYPPMGNNMMHSGPPHMYQQNMRYHDGGYQRYPRPYHHQMPYQGHRPPYGHGRYPGPRMYHHRAPPPVVPNVNQIYQEVQQTVGTGIIDDPLEAFNRIMREKEKKRTNTTVRRSPPPFMRDMNRDRRSRSRDAPPRPRRRSRSIERENRGRPPPKGRLSPVDRDRKKRRSRTRGSRSPRSRSFSR